MDRARKSSWTPAEDNVIRDLHNELGSRWTTIAKYLPGRSEQAIENRWQTMLKYQSESTSSFTRTRRRLSEDGGTSPETSFLMYSTLKEKVSKADFLTTDSMSTADSDLMLPSKLIPGSEVINECSESGFAELSSINLTSLCTTSDAAISVPLHEYMAAKGGNNLFTAADLTSIDASSLFNYTIPDVEVTNQSKVSSTNQSRLVSVANQSKLSAVKSSAAPKRKALAATPRILRSRQRKKKSQPVGNWKSNENHMGDFTALLRCDDSNSRDGSRMSSGIGRKSSANQRTPVGRGFKVTEPSPIHDLPFSPSQFLNSPVVTGLSCCDALTSTPLGKQRTVLGSSPVNAQYHHAASFDHSFSCHTPGALCLTPSGICQTPSFNGFVVPLTPTPIKNALLEFESKRNMDHRSYRVDLSGRLVEDVDELIRQDFGLSFIGSPVQKQPPVARRRRKLNVKVKRNCLVATPVSMTTRMRSSPVRNPRGRPPKEHYRARMQISFDEADGKPHGSNTTQRQMEGGGWVPRTDVMCGRTRDQREMTQLAKHWLRRRANTQLLFDH